MRPMLGGNSAPCGDHSTDSCGCQFADRELFADALGQLVDEDSGKHITVAMEVGVDDSTLSKWINNRKNPMPAWRLISWTRNVGPELLEWICRQCGYRLVPIRKREDVA